MTGTLRVTTANGVTTVDPDFAFEPGRPDRLCESLTEFGFPTTAQGIMSLVDEVRESRRDWTARFESGWGEGVTVYVPGLGQDIAGSGRNIPEAYARAFVNMRRDTERQAVYHKAGIKALQEYDAMHG